MGSTGYRVLIYVPTKLHTLWKVHVVENYYTELAMYYYRSFTMFTTKTRTSQISNTIKFRHADITLLNITPEDKVVNFISQLKK